MAGQGGTGVPGTIKLRSSSSSSSSISVLCGSGEFVLPLLFIFCFDLDLVVFVFLVRAYSRRGAPAQLGLRWEISCKWNTRANQ